MHTIMIVEDDQTIAHLIAHNIEKWQLKAYVVQDFNLVLDEFKAVNPHLVLMDINLPAFDGFYWNQKIREIAKTPIIFISSRNTNMDMIMAMNMGADDFVDKPFSIDVLMAKINALLRRTYNYSGPENEWVEHGPVKLDVTSADVQINGQTIELSKNEYKLLQFLMRHHGRIVSREILLRELWEDERFVDDNTLTVNINRLRKKIDAAGVQHYIVTKVGQGYIIP